MTYRRGLAWVLAAVVAFASLPASAYAQDDWWARDKAAHFGVTFAIAMGGYGTAALATNEERWRVLSGATMGLGAAAAKELLDRSHRGTPSWRDFAWGAIGTGGGVLAAWAIDRASGGRSGAAATLRPARAGFALHVAIDVSRAR